MQGWIKLHREILKWEWFQEPAMVQFYIYLLASASHNEYSWKGRTYKMGELPFGFRAASEQTGLSAQTVRTCVKRLKSTHEITIESSPQGSVITILNWDKYQLLTNDLTNDQQTINKRSTLTKNVKNDKNEKNKLVNETLRCLPPVKSSFELLAHEVMELWNATCQDYSMPRIITLNEKRKKKFREAYKEFKSIDDWKKIFEVTKEKGFTKSNGDTWNPSWDYIFRNENYIKLREEYETMYEVTKKMNPELSVENLFGGLSV
jgi:hypothetical protein